MPLCSTDNSYLASPDFLSFSIRSISCISIPIHLFGYYCILYKTPNSMISVKWLIFILHSCCFAFDVVITLFAVPYAVFPAMAGYGLGIIDSPGLFLYLIVTIITATTTSVFLIFENRYFVLFGENSWWRHVRKPVIAISYLLVPLYFLPAQFYIPEQESARKIVWESLGCQPELPQNRELFVLSTDFIAPTYSILIAELVPTIEVMVFTSLSNYHLLVAKPSSKLSKKSIYLQRKLSFIIMIQCYSDFFLFGLPVNAVVYIIKYWYHDQSINNLIFICLSFHGTASTLIMLLVHAPYRDFILSPFIRVLPKIPVILVRPNTSRE